MTIEEAKELQRITSKLSQICGTSKKISRATGKSSYVVDGAPGENRTPNLMVRSDALNPIEPRAH